MNKDLGQGCRLVQELRHRIQLVILKTRHGKHYLSRRKLEVARNQRDRKQPLPVAESSVGIVPVKMDQASFDEQLINQGIK